MPDPLAQEIIKEWEYGRADLGTTLSHCQQVANYLYPDRADFTSERAPGQKRMQLVYDSTPIFAHEMGAAGLHGMLTGDTMPWFMTVPDNERLWRDDEVRQWFAAADLADYTVFNSPTRNFAPQSHEVYLDVLAFGTAVMACLPHDRMGSLFSTRHLKEMVMFENDEDRIDHLNRRFQWTAKQAVQKWGAQAGKNANKAMADSKPNDKFWYHHRVKPRLKRDAQRADARHKPFESVYVCEDEQSVIAEAGFDLFPYLTPRLAKVSGETWGRGRGMMALPDIRELNEMMQLIKRAAQKKIDPPLSLPDDGYIIPIKQGPGALNYHRPGLRDKIEAILTQGDIQLGIELLQANRMAVKEAFFNQLFLTPTDPTDPVSAGKGVTATFTAKQQQENFRILSPLNSRLAAEWTAPIVERVRYNNWRLSVARRFGPGSPYPPPPDVLGGAPWHAEFKSPIHLSQRATELTAIDQMMARALQMRQIDPESQIIIDFEEVQRLEGRDLNVPVGILKSPERLRQEVERRARMAEQQHQAALAQQGAGAVADLAGARRQLREAA